MKPTPPQLREIHSLGKSTRERLVSARQCKALQSKEILFAGCTDAGPGYRFVRHVPDFHQILATTGGEGHVWVDGNWHVCSPGQAYLTPAGSTCAYEVSGSRRWQLCWLIYRPAPQPAKDQNHAAPRLIQADTTGLGHTISGLCHEASGEAEPAAMELWSALAHRHLTRMLQPSATDQRMERLWSLVKQDLGGDWNLARLARAAGMSAESLRRLCLGQFKEPPLTHLTRLRMQHAADLLACSREKIATIAMRVGYQDAFAFSNAFKRTMGLPPSKIRSGPK